jgi:hypothetical protein
VYLDGSVGMNPILPFVSEIINSRGIGMMETASLFQKESLLLIRFTKDRRLGVYEYNRT